MTAAEKPDNLLPYKYYICVHDIIRSSLQTRRCALRTFRFPLAIFGIVAIAEILLSMPGIPINPTAHRSKPEKPLKILTIDGGGLQAISTLLILDKLLDTIAKANKVPNRRPRPCDVFDVIAGIGAGGCKY